MSMTTRSRTRTRSHLPRSQSHQQQGIQRFTKTVKPGAALPTSKSLLLNDGEKEVVGCSGPSCQLTPSPSKKRKLQEITTTTNNDDDVAKASASASASTHTLSDPSVEGTPSKTLKFSDLSVSTPRSSRARTTRPRSSLQPPALKKSSPSSSSTSTVDEQRDTTISTKRPAAFTEFLNFHSSFLKALALHSAHNGYSTSADLRELLPGIEKIWRKRKVVIKDIQRIVQLWDDENVDNNNNNAGPRFRIANYGLGKICLERTDISASVPGSTGLFDENQFQERFVRLLERRWREQVTSQKDREDNEDIDDDISEGSPFYPDKLNLAPVHDCLTPFNTFKKGQQRLQDLKGGVIKVKTAMIKESAKPATAEGTSRDPVVDRRKSLFERIKNKELLQAKLGPPPTKEQILRRSAAQRVEDVIKVLIMLRPLHTMTKSNGAIAQKKPFMWQSIIQTIQDSMRNPIPAEEVGACLDILAQKDVAGDWIDIVTIRDLRSVVLMSGNVVSPREIGLKVSTMQF